MGAAPGAVGDGGPLPVVQDATGLACGLGYVALFALAAHRLSRRGGVGRAGR